MGDLVATTQQAIEQHAPADASAVGHCPPLVGLSATQAVQTVKLKRFLLTDLYRHPQVLQMTNLGRTVVAELFAAYLATPWEMPADYAASAERPRAVADYIAGMTDRFAQREHHRLTGRRLFAG